MIPSVKVDAKTVTTAFQSWLDLNDTFVPFFIEALGKQEDNRPWTLRGSVAKSFSTKSNPQGGPWRPLSEMYIVQKQKYYPGMPTLVASGTLFNSLVRTNGFSVVAMDKKKLVYGTMVKYAKLLQGGTKKMPSRAFLGFSDESRDTLKKLLAAYMKAGKDGKREALKRLRAGVTSK